MSDCYGCGCWYLQALGPNAFKYIDYWEGMTENHMIEFLSQVCIGIFDPNRHF